MRYLQFQDVIIVSISGSQKLLLPEPLGSLMSTKPGISVDIRQNCSVFNPFDTNVGCWSNWIPLLEEKKIPLLDPSTMMVIQNSSCEGMCLKACHVQACAVDPGSVSTNIYRNSSLFSRQPLKWLIENLYAPPRDGATAVLYAVTGQWHKSPRGTLLVLALTSCL